MQCMPPPPARMGAHTFATGTIPGPPFSSAKPVGVVDMQAPRAATAPTAMAIPQTFRVK